MKALVSRIENSPLTSISGVNAFVMLLSVTTGLILVRLLPKVDYGQLVYFYAGVGIMRLLMNLGLGFSMSRDSATNWEDPAGLRRVVYSTATLRLATILVGVSCAALLSLLTAQPFLGYIVLAGVGASLADFVLAIIAGSHRSMYIGGMSLSQPILYSGIILMAFLLGQASATVFMLGYAAAFILTALFGVGMLVHAGSLGLPRLDDLQLRYLRSVILFIIPTYIATLLSQVWVTVATGILGWQGDFQASAEFGVIFNLIALSISIITPTLLTVYYPRASRLYLDKQHDALLKHIRDTILLFSSGYIWVSITLFAFADEIILILFGDAYAVTADYLITLAPQPFLTALLPIFTLTLVAIGKPIRALLGLGAEVGILIACVLLFDVTPAMLSWAVLVSALAAVIIQGSVAARSLQANILPKGFALNLIAQIAVAWLLYQLVLGLGEQLTIWHFVLGGVFTLLYWGWFMISRRPLWKTSLS